MQNTRIIDAVELPYVRQTNEKTGLLLQRAVLELVKKTGIHLKDIDGLGVSSFTYAPDKAVDLAWQLSISPRWIQDDSNGGVSGLTLLQHAAAAIATGQATAIVLVAGDSFDKESFEKLITEYNSTNRDYLYPIGAANPNLLFSLLTKKQMEQQNLHKTDYAELVIQQREWATKNSNALYQQPLSKENYLNARAVSDVLGIYDCVPVAAGANAILLTHKDHPVAQKNQSIKIKALQTNHNFDQQMGDGLSTGLCQIKDALWQEAALTPNDIDISAIYDDYPVMILAQLEDLGFFDTSQAKNFIKEKISTRKFALNTSGGQLSCGQAGTAGSLHGAVEVINQLKGQAGQRQLDHLRYGLITGYGMIQYRYCMCSAVIILEKSQCS